MFLKSIETEQTVDSESVPNFIVNYISNFQTVHS